MTREEWCYVVTMRHEVERLMEKEKYEYAVTYRDEEQDWPAGLFDSIEKARECMLALTSDGYNAIISRVSRAYDNTNR